MPLRLSGSTSGFTEIDAPSVAGNNTFRLPASNGTVGQLLSTDGSGNLGWSNSYSDSNVITLFNATGTTPVYANRTWINFNSQGTITSASIRGSGNISSITDNGAGDYTLNYIIPMIDVNYAVTGNASELNANMAFPVIQVYTISTSSVRIRTNSNTAGWTGSDRDCVSVICVR